MTEKTYEDGVRAGFEACRKAAEAVCLKMQEDHKEGISHFAEEAEWTAVLMYTLRCSTAADIRHEIIALTPESPND